jgi:UDP-3-O-[3-hydroxymyristoyl] N-acetylglucosamine deacetylase
VGNGSSDVFVNMIEQAGVIEQDSTVEIRSLQHPVYHSEGDTHLIALPCDRFKVSYTLNYPDNELLKAQFFSTDVTPEIFKRELASCRSFGLYEEIGPLLDRGLIKGCSLANAVVIKGDVVFSKDGLFFPDEMVRHKV